MPTTTSSSSISVTAVTLSSSDITSLHSTPATLLPAPGSGFMYNLLSADWVYNFGTTAYSAFGYINICTKQSGNANTWFQIFMPGFLDQTSNQRQVDNGGGVLTSVWQPSGALSNFVNEPIVALIPPTGGGNPTTGDGTLTITLTYITVAV